MLRLTQTSTHLHIESFEPLPAAARLRIGDAWIIKSLNPGSNDFPCQGLLMDLQLLAMAKADIAPLYVARPVLNAADIILWFKVQGFGDMLTPQDMHVTICYSKQPVDWTCFDPAPPAIIAPYDYTARLVTALGKGPAAVLKFNSDELQARHAHMRSKGVTSDYPVYQPHVTLSYELGGRDLSRFAPFPFPIALGEEVFGDIDTDKEFIEKSALKRFIWDRRRGLRETEK